MCNKDFSLLSAAEQVGIYMYSVELDKATVSFFAVLFVYIPCHTRKGRVTTEHANSPAWVLELEHEWDSAIVVHKV
jgi:hypothetical protein